MIPCTRCGACCVAPDIAALDKPLGLVCPHLGPDALCTIYEQRPQVCRDYDADEVCLQIEAATLEQRVEKYLALFGLTAEADVVKRSQLLSMKQARAASSRAESREADNGKADNGPLRQSRRAAR